jgi:hypothetical protein
MTSQFELLEVPVAHLLEEAQRRAEKMGVLNRSMRGVQGAQVGCLGELVGMEYFHSKGIEYSEVFSTAYDVLINGSTTLEFKTKERTVAPLVSYDCTAPEYNKAHQKPDQYLFISLLSSGKSDKINRFTKAYILGTVNSKDFNNKATFWKKGQVDPSNGWKVTIDCWNIPISSLDAP